MILARARNIKPAFFMNEELAEFNTDTRLLFIGLWTLSDREGRLEDRPKRIKVSLFPYDSFDIDPMLDQLQSSDFLVRYEVDGSRFIQIKNFVKHQDPHYKEKASEIPPPDGHSNIINATGITRSVRAKILERDGYKCQHCSSTDALCIDHVTPVSRGGDSSEDNLQVLCNSCNTKKGNKLDGEVKGFNKSKHNQSSIISRVNINPNLNQGNDASPSDSFNLIPDSFNLIPDTTATESVTVDKKNNAKKPSEIKSPVLEIFEFWQDTMDHPGALLDETRRKAINGAIKIGYSQEQIKAAILGCSKTPHNIGENDRNQRYDGLKIILKDAEQIDRFIQNSIQPPVSRQSLQNQPSERKHRMLN